MDVANASTNWGTNVQMFYSSTPVNDEQKWFICGPYASSSMFYPAPALSKDHSVVFEVVNGGDTYISAGRNICINKSWYGLEGSDHFSGSPFHYAQTFNIQIISFTKPAKPAMPSFRYLSGNPDWTTISWYSVPTVGSYDSREYILEIYDTVNSEYVLQNQNQHVTGTSYTAKFPVGSYRAEIQAVNTKYFDYTSNWNTDGYFTVYPYRTVTLAANPAEGGTVYGGGIYSQGDYTALQVRPNEGWRFKGWIRNGQPVTNWNDDGSAIEEYGLTITKDEIFEAVFEMDIPPLPTHTISVSGTDGGAVAGGGTYQDGDLATVTAVPRDGYRFVRWTENGKGWT